MDSIQLQRDMVEAIRRALLPEAERAAFAPGVGEIHSVILRGVECTAFPVFVAKVERLDGGAMNIRIRLVMRLWDKEEDLAAQYGEAESTTEWAGVGEPPNAAALAEPLLTLAAFLGRRHPKFRALRERVGLSKCSDPPRAARAAPRI
ncbi:MAG: hypothetical protein V4639_04570 [Pseudomonadota bacterium]